MFINTLPKTATLLDAARWKEPLYCTLHIKTLLFWFWRHPAWITSQNPSELPCVTFRSSSAPAPPAPQRPPRYQPWAFCLLGNSPHKNQDTRPSSWIEISTIQHDTHLLHMDCCSAEEYFYLSFCMFYLRQTLSLSPTSLHFQWPHSRSKQIPSNFISEV